MSLARRIDYELARAREWRAGALEPLPDAEAVEAALERRSGPEAAVERARLLLGAPGEKAVAWLAALAALLVLLAAAAGAQVARAALGDPAEGPVNIWWFLAQSLGLQTLLLLVTLLAALAPRSALGRLLSQVLSLGGLLVGAAVRLAARARGREKAAGSGAETLERLRSLRALRPLALALSHGAWTAFNLGLIIAASAILYAEHHSFGWQSTLVEDEQQAERVLVALTLPSRAWPGGPDAEQVRASRWNPQEGGFVNDLGEPERAMRLRRAWSQQLLASVAGYGLLPRLLLLLASWLAWRWSRRRLGPPPGDRYLEAVLERLAPPQPEPAKAVAQSPLPEAPLPSPAAGPEPASPVPQVAAWLSAARGHDLAALLGPPWRELPRLDSRRGERAALEALEPPAELVLACDWSTTPDAALQSWMREAAPARAHLLLTGGAAFRATGRGASPEQVRARREVWQAAAERLGLPADALVEFDADSATAHSLAALRDRFAREGAPASGRPAAGGPAAGRPGAGRPGAGRRSAAAGTGLEAALARVEDAAEGWSEELGPLRGTELEAAQLRAAAEVRAEVERCFEQRPGPALVGPAVVKAAKTALRGAMEGRGLPDAAWSEALGEAARLGRLLARVKNIDPRWSAAGLALGLVAGPLGGAIAAGSAGLVAGASLVGTLAPLGAALGSALSLKRAAPQEAEAGASSGPVPDALGLPARAGVLRAVELALQGRGEETIARALGELLASEAGRAELTEPEDVESLCAEAERVVAASDEEAERGES